MFKELRENALFYKHDIIFEDTGYSTEEELITDGG